MCIPSDLLASKMLVTVNGQIPKQLEVKDNVFGKDTVMIRFTPSKSGIVLLTPSALDV